MMLSGLTFLTYRAVTVLGLAGSVVTVMWADWGFSLATLDTPFSLYTLIMYAVPGDEFSIAMKVLEESLPVRVEPDICPTVLSGYSVHQPHATRIMDL